MFITFESRSFPTTSHNLKAMKKYNQALLAMITLKRLCHAEMYSIERAEADCLLKVEQSPGLRNQRSLVSGCYHMRHRHQPRAEIFPGWIVRNLPQSSR